MVALNSALYAPKSLTTGFQITILKWNGRQQRPDSGQEALLVTPLSSRPIAHMGRHRFNPGNDMLCRTALLYLNRVYKPNIPKFVTLMGDKGHWHVRRHGFIFTGLRHRFAVFGFRLPRRITNEDGECNHFAGGG
jgi:hypothetical protein